MAQVNVAAAVGMKSKMKAESSGGERKKRTEKKAGALVQTFLDDDRCKSCDKLMSQGKGDGRIVVNANSWHRSCWVCAHCKGPLPTDRVLFNPDNDLPVCTSCWHKHHAVNCAKCDKQFEPSEVITSAYEKRYHKDCFQCSKCKEVISEEEFVDINNAPYHDRCC